MHKMLLSAACILAATMSSATSAQYVPEDWPNKWPPKEFKWPILWPVNRAASASDFRHGPEYFDTWRKYTNLYVDSSGGGMAVPLYREGDYRKDLGGDLTAKFVSQMKLGDVETWKGRGFTGSFKLIAMDKVGPLTCRQTEWTLSGSKGQVSVLRLFCLDEVKGKWVGTF